MDRVGAVLLVLGLVVFARIVDHLVVGALHEDWNGCYLAPIVALTRGYQLYYPPTEGPVLDTIYGPVAELVYLPVALFTTPTAMILLGAALNIAFVTVPLLIFALRAAGTGRTAELRAITSWLGVCLLMTALLGPYLWLLMTHSDSPTLALGLLACLILIAQPGEPAPGSSRLAVAAILATLAAWAKQTSVPIGVSLVPFIGWAYGGGAAARYALWLLAAGLTTAALVVPVFGFEEMWFNLVAMPSRHPWYFPGASGLLHVSRLMAEAAGPVLALLVAAGLIRLGQYSTSPTTAYPALVPLFPALFLVPTGVLAANKFGGLPNSFHSLYFLLASVLGALLAEGAGPPARALSRASAYALCALGLVVAWRHGYVDLCGPAPQIFPNPHQQAYDFARAHPDTAYFPWHPLSTLLAEGKLAHFAYGVVDRTLGGSPPTAEHFRAHIPQHVRWVVVRGDRDPKVMQYLSEFTEVRTTDELPGWRLLARPEAGPEARPRSPANRRGAG